MNFKWLFVFILLIIVSGSFYYWQDQKNQKRILQLNQQSEELQKKLEQSQAKFLEVRKKYSWHRWYHSEYAAELRRQQYNTPTEGINDIYFKQVSDFIPIENLLQSLVCSKQSNTVFDKDYIYWSARVLPLKNKGDYQFYSTSYIGKGSFAHSNKAFDAFINRQDFSKKNTHKKQDHGLTSNWINKNKSKALHFGNDNPYGNSAIFSYNTGDIDNDEKDDFIFNDRLILSSLSYKASGSAPRRGLFWKKQIIGLNTDSVDFFTYNQGQLEKKYSTPLKNPPHSKTPYAMFLLPGDLLAIHTQTAIDIYRLTPQKIIYFATLTNIESGEVQFGGLGDFTSDGQADIWISQVNTPEHYPGKKDHVSLLDLSLLKPGPQKLQDITHFKINGSSKYSDYDGIGSSMSPIAGDIDKDGQADFSFTGHRHMSEAGALYIVMGKHIKKAQEIDITHPTVTRIVGRPMSQIAPPFHHWDATDYNNDGFDDLVIPVDNDVCAGLHSGSIYLLDGKKVTQRAQNTTLSKAKTSQ